MSLQSASQCLLSVGARLRPGQEEAWIQKLAELRLEARQLMPGSVTRYISRQRGSPAAIQLVLLWHQSVPGEEERQASLAALRAELDAYLDWEDAAEQEWRVLLNT